MDGADMSVARTLVLAAALWASTSWAAVDVNTATEAELDSIRGLGPAGTARILKAREVAPFKDWTYFTGRVKGIKPATAAKLSKSGLTVNHAPYPDAETR